jgi:hypothetical protein
MRQGRNKRGERKWRVGKKEKERGRRERNKREEEKDETRKNVSTELE